jgi:hypothetical protein
MTKSLKIIKELCLCMSFFKKIFWIFIFPSCKILSHQKKKHASDNEMMKKIKN